MQSAPVTPRHDMHVDTEPAPAATPPTTVSAVDDELFAIHPVLQTPDNVDDRASMRAMVRKEMNLNNWRPDSIVLHCALERALYPGSAGGTIQQMLSPSSTILYAGITPQDARAL